MLSRSRKPSCGTTENGAFTCAIGICNAVRVKVTSDPMASRSLLLKEIRILLRLESSETNFEHIVRYYQAWQEHGASQASSSAVVDSVESLTPLLSQGSSISCSSCVKAGPSKTSWPIGKNCQRLSCGISSTKSRTDLLFSMRTTLCTWTSSRTTSSSPRQGGSKSGTSAWRQRWSPTRQRVSKSPRETLRTWRQSFFRARIGSRPPTCFVSVRNRLVLNPLVSDRLTRGGNQGYRCWRRCGSLHFPRTAMSGTASARENCRVCRRDTRRSSSSWSRG